MIFKERLARTYGAGLENFGLKPSGALCSAMYLWLGPTDMAAIFVIALLLFGPEQLPRVARQLGDAMRHMQDTTHSFMLEMDRAAREADVRPHTEPEPDPEPIADTAAEAWAESETPPRPVDPQPKASGDNLS